MSCMALWNVSCPRRGTFVTENSYQIEIFVPRTKYHKTHKYEPLEDFYSIEF